ncbi:beta strand repeat-containing protein [Burkholderia guangdongensis]|uniref:beta strand repeat-containing protein n=1 Tax=Burkholderia guangdongensis TaxID=1792500 RepID=UPI0015C7CCFC|nr:autotransporter-associated beta strand repeat-containing protein [Burkholderia guangdongensis]
MRRTRKEARSEYPKFVPCAGVFLALVGAGIVPAHAGCSQAGTTVTCSGIANPLQPDYANSADNLNVTVNPGSSLGVLLGIGGTSLALQGSGVTLTNNGTIDPTALGAGLGVLSSGLQMGNASASTATVTNNGTINGTTGVALAGVTGMAIGVQNGTGGVTNITNTGSIGSNPLIGATLVGADAPVVVAYGGSLVNFNNSGTINGRVAFEPSGTPGAGNTFVNSGTINGSVSMGANSTNRFTADTGSSVNTAGGTGSAINLGIGATTVSFAATGTVDGGAGGNNTLVLQKSSGGPATGSISNDTYVDFEHLQVDSGTWTISGAGNYNDATLAGGVAVIDNAASLGTGTIMANGGAIESATSGLNVSNNVNLALGSGLTVQGANDLTLSGTIGGAEQLTMNGTGALTLTNVNSYISGTNLNSGSLIVGNDGALGTGMLTVGGSATLDATYAATLGNDITINTGAALTLGGSYGMTLAGQIVGAGSLVKDGPGTTTLTGLDSYTGGTTINGGTLALGAGVSLAATGSVDLAGAGATFDISGSGANQTIGALSGAAGSNVALGANTLTFGDSTNQTFAGVIAGTAGIVKQGTGTETLTGTNTYNGGTTIDAGTLALGAGGSLVSTGSVDLAGAGATFDISGSGASQTIRALSGAAGSTVALGANTLTFGDSTNQTLGASVSGTGGLVKQGSGTQTLTGANTYTGGTTINAGTLALGAGGSLASTGSVDLANAGTAFDISAAGNQTIGALSGAAGSNVNLGANTLTFGNSTNQTLGSSVSGTGGLVKQGTGTQTLTGANTYTGGTTISAGTLALGAGGSLASTGSVDLANAGTTFDISAAGGNLTLAGLSGAAGSTVALGANTLTLSGTTNATFAGGIGGTGGLVKQGSGTQTLTGASTYGGGTTIDAGTLAIAQDASLGSTTGALTLNGGTLQTTNTLSTSRNVTLAGTGTFDTNAGTTLTLSGNVSGSGALVKTGGGTLTLTGAGTHTGGTTIDSGTLEVGAGGTLSGLVTLAGPGAVFELAPGGSQTVSSLTGASGDILVGGGTLTVGSDGTNQTYGGTVSGGGTLVKQGAGAWVLDGTSSGFSGTTEVAAGLLEVGDIDTPGAVLGGNVLVDANGTLRGHGTIGGNVVNDGVVMPGGTIGTLTVSGNYSQAASGTLSIEVSPSAGSALAVGGSATLNGVLAIVYDPGTYSARQYTILSAANGVSGRFTSVTGTAQSGANLGSLQQSVSYGSNAVDLVLAAAQTTSPTSPTPPVVVAPTGTSIYTALGTSASVGAQSANAALLERLGRGSPATAGSPNGWVNATASQTKVGGNDVQPGFQSNQYGFMAGLDNALGDAIVGVAAGYTHTDIDEQGTGDSGTIDTLRAALYGSRQVGPVGLSATAGYALDFLSQKRPFDSIGTAQGDHIGQEFTAAGEASMPLTLGSLVLTPRVGLRYAYFHGNGFDESGANGQNLAVGTDNAHSLQPYAELTLDQAFGSTLKPVNVQLRAGYARELLDAGRTMTVTAQDSTVFAAPGTGLPRSYLTAGIGVSMQPLKSLTVAVRYDALINTGHASAQAANVQVGYQF